MTNADCRNREPVPRVGRPEHDLSYREWTLNVCLDSVEGILCACVRTEPARMTLSYGVLQLLLSPKFIDSPSGHFPVPRRRLQKIVIHIVYKRSPFHVETRHLTNNATTYLSIRIRRNARRCNPCSSFRLRPPRGFYVRRRILDWTHCASGTVCAYQNHCQCRPSTPLPRSLMTPTDSSQCETLTWTETGGVVPAKQCTGDRTVGPPVKAITNGTAVSRFYLQRDNICKYTIKLPSRVTR